LNHDYETAERIFLEAQQLSKVNHGLVSELQIPALQLLIQSLIPQRRWQSVDQYLAYFEWINSNSLRRDIETYLSGAAILSQLYLQAAASPGNPASARYLIAAKHSNWRAVSAIEAVFGRESLRLPPWLYKVVVTHFYQSRLNQRRGMSSYEFQPESQEIVSGLEIGRNESIERSYEIGLQTLKRIQWIYARSEIASREVNALLLVHFGDWELVFGNENAALAYYETAQAEFADAGFSQQRINAFFENPIVLPAAELQIALDQDISSEPDQALTFAAWSPKFPGVSAPFLEPPTSIPDSFEFKVNATFDLLPQQRTRTFPRSHVSTSLIMADLEIASIAPDSEDARRRARQEISALQVRPGVRNGNFIAREGIQLEYYAAPVMQQFVLTGF